MPDAKSRAKVQRLLRGDFREGDLKDLFRFARDHCDGRRTIKDIGDFVAHHNERDRGLITASIRDWFTVVRFHIPIIHRKSALDAKNMPPAFRDYMKIAVNRIDAKIVSERTKLRKADAYKMSLDVAGRLKGNDDGTWALPDDITKSELAVVNCVCSMLVAKPAFDDSDLVKDFLSTLKNNGLITKDELATHATQLGTLVKLFAVATMHNCVVQIGDGTKTQLKAKIHEGVTDKVSVTASVPDAIPSMPKIYIATNMFEANLTCADHCSAELLEKRDWDFELELGQDKKLAPLH